MNILEIPLEFFLAIAIIESSMDPSAIGDNGRSYGIYQIQEIYIEDVNRIYGTDYEWPRDAIDQQKATSIVTLYLSHYGSAKRLGKPATMEQLARIHNGGPNGHLKKSTEKYADKFFDALEALRAEN